MNGIQEVSGSIPLISTIKAALSIFYIDLLDGAGFFVFGGIMKNTEGINEYKAYAAVKAMRKISMLSKENGLDNMSLEEINTEISAVRAERTEQSE